MNKVNLNIISFNEYSINKIGKGNKGDSGGGDTPIEKPIGVYIYTIDKEFITTDDWNTANNDKVVGVFFNDGEHDFVIALHNISSHAYGGYNKLLTSIPAISIVENAKLDFNGKNNTLNIIQELDGYIDENGIKGAPAAEACANYTFPNGAKGYLPALGELNLLSLNQVEINNAISKCNGLKLHTNWYWSSTQYNADKSWYVYMSHKLTVDSLKNNYYYVRAFCKI